MFVKFEAMGTVEIHGVRRIEEDHLCWYVWYGKPSDGSARGSCEKVKQC